MTDFPIWCDRCEEYGFHHTDRHCSTCDGVGTVGDIVEHDPCYYPNFCSEHVRPTCPDCRPTTDKDQTDEVHQQADHS